MQVIYERCCGIDVHKKVIVCCLRKVRKSEIRKFGTYTWDLQEMTQWLLEANCQMVAMESTGPSKIAVVGCIEVFLPNQTFD